MNHKLLKQIKNILIFILLIVGAGAIIIISISKARGLKLKESASAAVEDVVLFVEEAAGINQNQPIQKEVTQTYVNTFAQGNYIIGKDIHTDYVPAGTYQISGGLEKMRIFLYEEGNLLHEYTIGGTEETAENGILSDIELKENDILVILGTGQIVLTSQGQLTYYEITGLSDAQYQKMEPGVYTVGEEVEAGTARAYLTDAASASVKVNSSAEGGADITLEKNGENASSYSNIILNEGDIITITGGAVTFEIR